MGQKEARQTKHTLQVLTPKSDILHASVLQLKGAFEVINYIYYLKNRKGSL